MTHTPTPWGWTDDSTKDVPAFFSIYSEPAGGCAEGAILYITLRKSEGKANARRIVAAVNATADIPVTALEQGVIAELVAVVRTIPAMLGNVKHNTSGGENAAQMRGDMLEDIRALADKALAKLGGQHDAG